MRRASAMAHHCTPKMVLRSVIFSTRNSDKIIYNWIQSAHLQHIWVSTEVVFVAQQAFLKDKAWLGPITIDLDAALHLYTENPLGEHRAVYITH